jgi:hypothetical protein
MCCLGSGIPSRSVAEPFPQQYCPLWRLPGFDLATFWHLSRLCSSLATTRLGERVVVIKGGSIHISTSPSLYLGDVGRHKQQSPTTSCQLLATIHLQRPPNSGHVWQLFRRLQNKKKKYFFFFIILAFVFQPQCLDTLSLRGMLVYMWGMSHIGKIGSQGSSLPPI